MPSWWLLVLLVLVWLLWGAAAAGEKAVAEARRGIPPHQRGGVSVLPVVPLFPLVFWGLAALGDYFATPWGTWVIGGLHLCLAIAFVVTIVRAALHLRDIGGSGISR